MKESLPPEFNGLDHKGYFRQDEYGKWRSLTVEDGILTCLRPKFRDRIFETKGGEIKYDDLRTRGQSGRHNKY